MEARDYVRVNIGGQSVSVAPGESLLVACERAGVPVTPSCRAGACQSCLMRATSGTPPAGAQAGLKPAHKIQGYFLACICHPREELSCEVGDVDSFRGTATISSIDLIGSDIVSVKWHRPAGLDFFAGQFLSFRWPDGITRSYSIASLPSQQNEIEIHVRRIVNGQKSVWFHDDAMPGDSLEIAGPRGDCFYACDDPTRPLLLIGAGTGMAPLYAIARDALENGHAGRLQILQAGLSQERLYLVEQLQELVATHEHVNYVRCVKDGEASCDVRVGDVNKVTLELVKECKTPLVYLCGDARLVTDLRKRLFIAGVSLKDIHADAFVGNN